MTTPDIDNLPRELNGTREVAPPSPSPAEVIGIADELGISPQQIEPWLTLVERFVTLFDRFRESAQQVKVLENEKNANAVAYDYPVAVSNGDSRGSTGTEANAYVSIEKVNALIDKAVAMVPEGVADLPVKYILADIEKRKDELATFIANELNQ